MNTLKRYDAHKFHKDYVTYMYSKFSTKKEFYFWFIDNYDTMNNIF